MPSIAEVPAPESDAIPVDPAPDPDSTAESQVEYGANLETKLLDVQDASSGVFEHFGIESDIREFLTSPAVDSTLKDLQAPVADFADAVSNALSATGAVGTVLSLTVNSACRTVVQGLMNIGTCVPLFGKLFQLGLAVFRQADEYEEMQRVFDKLCNSMYSGLRLLQLLAAAASTSQSDSDMLQTLQTFRTALVSLLGILALVKHIEDASTFRKFVESSDMRKDIVDVSSAFRNNVQDVLLQAQTDVLRRLTSVEHRTDAVEQQLNNVVSSTEENTEALSVLQQQVDQQRKHLRNVAVASALSSTNVHHCWQQVVCSITRAASHGGVLGIPPETNARMQVHVPLQVTVTTRDTAENFAADIVFQRVSTGCTTRNALFADTDDQHLRDTPGDVGVFLLQGSAGSGKTHTGWHVWQQAALQCAARQLADCQIPPTDCLVPLFISLNHFRDAALSGNLLQSYFEYFDGLGTTPEAAVESLRVYGRFLIILDGLDELADKETNIYMKNELHRWTNSVVCISSRTGFLSSVNRGIETLIAPINIMNNAPQMAQVQPLYIRQFNDEQRSEYIRKYCSAALTDGNTAPNANQVTELMSQYETHLAQMQDMQSLTSSPLTLFMLLDVLPHMHKNMFHLGRTYSTASLTSAPTYLRTTSSVDTAIAILAREAQEKPLRLNTDELELSRNCSHVFPKLRQVEVYAVFLHHWLQRETDRLVNAGVLNRQDQVAVIGEAEDFCAKLAFEMFLHDRTSIQWRGSGMSAPSDSKTQKLSRRQRRRLQQQPSLSPAVPHSIMQLLTETQQQHDGLAFAASPLVRSGSSYSFFHKSIRDYLAAYHVCSQVMDACLDDGDDCMAWSDRLQRVDAIAELMLSKRCLTADYAVLSFAGELVAQRYSLSHPYRASWPVSSWTDFCDSKLEHANSQTGVRAAPSNRQPLLKALFDVIEASKHLCRDGDSGGSGSGSGGGGGGGDGDDDSHSAHALTVRTAAANAISVLNAANVSFAGMDFSDIQIGHMSGSGTQLPTYPAADLSGALLYGADLSGANLCHVCLESAALDDCKLTGTVFNDALFGQRPKINPGHTGTVLYVVYDRARDWLITAARNNAIRVTTASSGEGVAVLKGHHRRPSGLSYDAKSGVLASAGLDRTVRIWDVLQAKCVHILKHNSVVRCVSFDAPSQTVVSGVSDGTVLVWDSVSGKCRHVLQSSESYAIWCVLYDASISTIFAGNDKGKMFIWTMDEVSHKDGVMSVDSDPAMSSFQAHPSSRIRSIAFDPEHSLLLAVFDDGIARIWDASNGFDSIDQPLRSCSGHVDWCRSMAYDSATQRFATASRDGTVRLWDACSGVCVSNIDTGSKDTHGVSFDATNDVVYAAVGRHIQVWDLSVTGRLSKASRSSSSSVTALFLEEKSYLTVSGDLDGCVHVWDLHSGQIIHSFVNHDSAVSAVCVDPHNRWLVSASCGGSICIRDLHEHDTDSCCVLAQIPTSSVGVSRHDWACTLCFKTIMPSSAQCSTVVVSTVNGAALQWDLENRCWSDYEQSAIMSDSTTTPSTTVMPESCEHVNVFPPAVHGDTLSVYAHGHGVRLLRHTSLKCCDAADNECVWSSDPYILSHNSSGALNSVGLTVREAEANITDWNSALWYACEQNLSSRVAFLVRQAKCDPDAVDSNGWTPVYIASKNGHLGIVRYLVGEAKCDPSQARKNGWSPVFVASLHGHLDIVRYLVDEAKCDPNQATNNGATPVYIASKRGRLDIVRFLVAVGKCDPNQANNDGATPVSMAAQWGHLDTVRYLVGEAKCDPNQAKKGGATPVSMAAQWGCLDTVRYLVGEVKCDPNQADNNGATPMFFAALLGHLDIVRYLVGEAKCDPNQANNGGWTPVSMAAWRGHLDTVRYLVGEAKCDPNQVDNDGWTPVYIASHQGHLDIVRYLVAEAKCDPNHTDNNGITPVYIASQYGHLDIVRYLVADAKCDANQASKRGWTPVYIASHHGHLHIVRYLVGEGKCDANQANINGTTPLFSASLHDHLDIVRYLVEEVRCDPHRANKKGITPVYIASQKCHLDIVRYLVEEAKCDPNQADNNGITPVYAASKNGHLDIVRYLVEEARCDPCHVRANGWASIDVATHNNHFDIVEYLTLKQQQQQQQHSTPNKCCVIL
jgi:ankyrin repeat protein/WD40 repeat protein